MPCVQLAPIHLYRLWVDLDYPVPHRSSWCQEHGRRVIH